MSENRGRGARDAGRRALQALFLSVQHPGQQFGTRTDAAAAPRGSNWPHRRVGAPPQPAVVAIRRRS